MPARPTSRRLPPRRTRRSCTATSRRWSGSAGRLDGHGAPAQGGSSSSPAMRARWPALGELLEERGDVVAALAAYERPPALGPDRGARRHAGPAARAGRGVAQAARASTARSPTRRSVTRADLAALLGVRLETLIARAAAAPGGDHRRARALGAGLDHGRGPCRRSWRRCRTTRSSRRWSCAAATSPARWRGCWPRRGADGPASAAKWHGRAGVGCATSRPPI